MNYRTQVQVDGMTGTPAKATLKPRWALVYSEAVNDAMGSTPRFNVFTHHDIDQEDREDAQLSEGIPVCTEDAIRLLAQLAGADIAMLPDGVFAYGLTGMAWTVPAKQRPMLVRRGDHIQRLQVPWPNLLFIAAGHQLKVYARKKTGRPQPDEPLFHAPLPNIYHDGTMCWGDIEVPAMGVKNIPHFEAAVFESAFTHANHDLAIAGMKDRDDLMRFWRELSRTKAMKFPTRRLVAAHTNVASACNVK